MNRKNEQPVLTSPIVWSFKRVAVEHNFFGLFSSYLVISDLRYLKSCDKTSIRLQCGNHNAVYR